MPSRFQVWKLNDHNHVGIPRSFEYRRRTAFALSKHSPNFMLHAQKHTKHIRVENGLIAFRGDIGSRTGTVPALLTAM